jgi:hypothetical protein
LRNEDELNIGGAIVLTAVVKIVCIDNLRTSETPVTVGVTKEWVAVGVMGGDVAALLGLLCNPVPGASGKKTPLRVTLGKVETGNNGVVEARLLIDSEVETYALLDNKIGVGVLGTTGGAIVALPTPAGGNISPVNEFT